MKKSRVTKEKCIEAKEILYKYIIRISSDNINLTPTEALDAITVIDHMIEEHFDNPNIECLKESDITMKWIPVTERLPEYSGNYLVCFDDGFIATASYVTDIDGIQDWVLWDDSGDVVEWMPLPRFPYVSD